MRSYRLGTAVVAACWVALAATAWAAAPKGAKAIFDSGSGGGTIGMSVNARPAPTGSAMPVAEKYAGISYQILVMGADGQMQPVSKSRTFRSGERVKILASAYRPGYLTVANIGSSGQMQVLFSEYVDARRLTQIPPDGNLRFDAMPGTEKLLLMLSNEPNPLAPGRSANIMAAAPAPAPAPVPAPVPVVASAYPSPQTMLPPTMPGEAPMAAAPTYPPVPAPSTYPPMAPEQASASLVASLDGAKSLKIKGAKDLVVDDGMENSYTVVAPTRSGYQTVRGGAKDLLVESADGMNYGMVPTAAMAGGGILTLEIKLKHR